MPETQSRIHPTSIIGQDVILSEDTIIGPFCILKGNIEIGPQCVIDSHVHIEGNTRIGRGNRFGSGCVIGGEPQSITYRPEHQTSLEIGEDNYFREYVTLNRGTLEGGGKTVIGNRNYLMTGAHVAHDCIVGNEVKIANYSSLGGHVEVHDGCFISAYVGIQQRTRVGRLVIMGGHARTTKDIPPFMSATGQSNIFGLNLIGMRRSGMPRESINAVKQAFDILYNSGLTTPNAAIRMRETLGTFPEVLEIAEFLETTKIGICRKRTVDYGDTD